MTYFRLAAVAASVATVLTLSACAVSTEDAVSTPTSTEDAVSTPTSTEDAVSTPTSTEDAVSVVSRANQFNLIPMGFGGGKDPSSMAFVIDSNSYSVTSGQPWGTENNSIDISVGQGETLTMTIQAGRQGSSAPANFYINALNGGGFCSGNGVCNTIVSQDGTVTTAIVPDATMNFAFTGTLVLGDTSYYPVVIGQSGGEGVGNCWAIGGPGWSGKFVATPGPPSIYNWEAVYTPDGNYLIYEQVQGDNLGACGDSFNVMTSAPGQNLPWGVAPQASP